MMMNKIAVEEITLMGLSLKKKTSNANGQSNIDCGNLWQKFEQEDYANKITGKLNDEILAVYHDYEGDHTKPFSYFIGYKVKPGESVLQNLDILTIPKGLYQKITSTGEMPGCVVNAWKAIWDSDIRRAYIADFEIYGEKSKNWNNAEVDIFISIEG